MWLDPECSSDTPDVVNVQEHQNQQNVSHLRFGKAFIREQALLWKCGLLDAAGHLHFHVSQFCYLVPHFEFKKLFSPGQTKNPQHSKRLQAERPPAAAPRSDGPTRLQGWTERCFTVPLESNYFWHFSKTVSEVWLKVSRRWRVSGRHSQSHKKANCAINHTKGVCHYVLYFFFFLSPGWQIKAQSDVCFCSSREISSVQVNSLLQFCIIDALRW